MLITDFLEKNARLYGREVSLVELNPTEEHDKAKTWREFSLIESSTDQPFRREMTWDNLTNVRIVLPIYYSVVM